MQVLRQWPKKPVSEPVAGAESTAPACVAAADTWETAMARQFVIQLANRPGELAHLTRALAERGIDIHDIASTSAGTLASASITTSDDGATRDVLCDLGLVFIEGSMVVVDVADRPGGFADAAEQLAAGGVNILGALVIGRRAGVIEVAFSVDKEEAALAALGLTGHPGLPL